MDRFSGTSSRRYNPQVQLRVGSQVTHRDVARQREETRQYNQAFVKADAYDYELAKRVQEQGFYD